MIKRPPPHVMTYHLIAWVQFGLVERITAFERGRNTQARVHSSMTWSPTVVAEMLQSDRTTTPETLVTDIGDEYSNWSKHQASLQYKCVGMALLCGL